MDDPLPARALAAALGRDGSGRAAGRYGQPFGPELKRFILSQYHQGQVTIPRLLTLLQDLGIDISKRQIVRLLSRKQDAFLAEAREVLRAGLGSARWITVDDTGARHKAKNGFCTHIGNDRFAFFATTYSKSRLNFLELLRAGQDDYVINAAALDYMRDHKLPQATIALSAGSRRTFTGRDAFMEHLRKARLTDLKVRPDPVQSRPKALYGARSRNKDFWTATVTVSDGAGQFKIAEHALCWVHAERLIHKLDTFCEAHVQAKERIRARIWPALRHLKAYRQAPARRRARELGRRFDSIFSTQTGFATSTGCWRGCMPRKKTCWRWLKRPGDPVAHQRLGKRHTLPSDAAQNLRRHPIRPGARQP